MKQFFDKAAMQNHPLRALEKFLTQETANETAKKYDDLRFVGYVLEMGYDTVTIITSDPFKIAVGGVPRNSLLIMVPSVLDSFPPHFTLLRVLESAPTPLSKEVQQTYFELQKKSMPELDVFTQSELQWGALNTGVLGMFYPHPEKSDAVEFSGDLNNFVSAHKYKVFSPNDELLNLIVNSMVPEENRFSVGQLRLTECRLPLPNKVQPDVKVFVSTKDFKGGRTAMFGKTRLGKSNIVKIIAQSLIETTKTDKSVGQLIFDINGEYANDNPQDDNTSLKSVYPDRCIVYALAKKESTESKPLKLNFYEQPDSSHKIIGTLLKQSNRAASGYVQNFITIELPNLDEVKALPAGGDQTRAIRQIQIYWGILHKTGYEVDENKLKSNAPKGPIASMFNPGFKEELRLAAYDVSKKEELPQAPQTLDEMVNELETIAKFRRENPDSKVLKSSSGGPVFSADDGYLLDFLSPSPGRSGYSYVQPYRKYHDKDAGHFINEIIESLDQGKTVILDLGNADEEIRNYFSLQLSNAVMSHQTDKFTNNKLGNHYIQLYFEEAHNLFPREKKEVTSVYSRFAKEGAKYHIGMVYSTQSPTTILSDLLAQTENFFIAHLSSQEEVEALARLNIAYSGLKSDILQAKTPGYVRMLTRSHRFVVPVQAKKFEAKA